MNAHDPSFQTTCPFCQSGERILKWEIPPSRLMYAEDDVETTIYHDPSTECKCLNCDGEWLMFNDEDDDA